MGRTSAPASQARVLKRATRRAFKVTVDGDAKVSAQVRLPAGHDPLTDSGLLLAHGAGSDMQHAFMEYFYEELGERFPCGRFNFLYKEQGRKAPDTAKRLEATYRAVVHDVVERTGIESSRLFIGGKSMGGRIATHLAAAGDAAAGVVLLGYPLHPPGRPEKLRDAHLTEIRCPLLFVQGTRDKLCDLDLLKTTLKRVRAPWHLHVIDEGDHSFKVPKRTGRSADDVLAEIRDVVGDWVQRGQHE